MKTMLLALVGVAVQGATVTSTSSYSAALGPDGILNISVYAPRFNETLGTLISLRMAGTVGVVADATIGTTNTVGDLEALFGMGIKLKWPDNPVYDQRAIDGAAIHVASVSPQAIYFFPGAISGSAGVALYCASNFSIRCDLPSGESDYRFSLRFSPYRQVSLPHTFALAAGTVNADFTATYEYEPAAAMIHNPEPSAWALLAAGLGGLAYYRRRCRG